MSATRRIAATTALLCLVLISGCGRTVRESFYRLSIGDRPDSLRDYSSSPRRLSFSPEQGVLLDFLVQGSPAKLPLVYMSMRLERGTTFKWTSRSLAWLDGDGATISTGEIASMRFTNYCKPPPERECSIANTSLSDGPVVTREYSWGKGKMFVYTIAPTSLLHGAELRKVTNALQLGSGKWLNVTSELTIDATLATPRTRYLLRLPDVQINGRTVPMPIVDIQWVSEDVFEPAPPIND
ncbi:hypothetical protein ACW9YV_11490 [Paraburkholderia strydomiana]